MKNQVLIHVLGSILFILLIVGYWDVVWLFQECTSKIVITYVRLSDFLTFFVGVAEGRK